VEEIREKLSQIPGVQTAGAISLLPLQGEDWINPLRDPDRPARPEDASSFANFRFVTPDYWTAAGVPLKRGRFLDISDRNRPTAVISERAARYLWPGDDPIGKHVSAAVPKPQPPSLEVVGVVGDVRTAMEDEPRMMVYEHYWRMQPIAMSFVLRTQAEPRGVMAAVRKILSSADPEMAIPAARTMEQIVDSSVAGRKVQMNLVAAFAISALLLAALGVYGVVSFTVARRAQEIGIRIALGASEPGLLAMVVRQGMYPVVAGLLMGVAAAASAGPLIASQLYGVTPHDPWAILSVAGTLLVVSVAACWLPARRASRLDPLRALRLE
jgi:putative ABC transport system permease protein